jgi:hypothetical protein
MHLCRDFRALLLFLLRLAPHLFRDPRLLSLVPLSLVFGL